MTSFQKILGSAAAILVAAFSISDLCAAEFKTEPLHIHWDQHEGPVTARWDIRFWTKHENAAFALGAEGRPQIKNVFCDDHAVEMTGDHEWLMPKGCKELRWELLFDAENEVSAADQRSFFYDDPLSIESGFYRHFIISDRLSLLRPVEGQQPDAIFFNVPYFEDDACGRRKGGWLCPWNPEGPPDFLLLGDGIFGHGSDNVKQIRPDGGPQPQEDYFYGHEDYFYDYGYGLSYLERLLDGADRYYSVYWKPTCLDGEVNAATGERLILLSRPCADDMPARLRILIILFHEAVHIYSQDGPAMPLWANESLASYYSLKAMDYAADGVATTDGIDKDAYAKLRALYLNAGQQSPEYGLLEAQRLVESGEDPAAYGQFYFRGALFWNEVDSYIITATEGEKNLDDYFPFNWKGEWGEHGELPKSLMEELAEFDSAQWAQLVEEFLE